MPFVLSLLKPLGSILLSMLGAVLTGPVLKRLAIHFLEAEAQRYMIRAAETEGKQDDARAKMFLRIVVELRLAWGLGSGEEN